MNTPVNKYTCTRCGAVKLVELTAADFFAKRNNPPEGWHSWTHRGPSGSTEDIDTCADCHEEIVEFMTGGTLLHIGHARQSGSGKTWTELGIEDKDDKELWFPVYALVSRQERHAGKMNRRRR